MNTGNRLSRRKFLKQSSAAILAGTASVTAAELLSHRNKIPSDHTISPPSARGVHTSHLPAARFTDITANAGLNFIQKNGMCKRRYFCEQVAAGAAMFDATGDGSLDIYFPQP